MQEAYNMVIATIDAGGFDLGYMIRIIDRMWMEGSLDATERESLKDYAREHAVPANSYAPVEQRLLSIEQALLAIEARLDALEAGGGGEGGGVSSEPVDEWPAWVQPTGAHDAYNTGDQVTYNGRRYVCQIDACVWAPTDYPAGWQEYVAPTPDPEPEPEGDPEEGGE